MKTIREITKWQKFNGKIYGKKDAYSIYVNGNKVDVSNEQAAEYRAYITEYESIKESFPKVLENTKCFEIAKENGVELSAFIELSLEQMKAKIALFEIETKHAEQDGIKATLQIARYKGEIVSVYAENSLGYSVYADTEKKREKLFSQFKHKG